MKEINRNPEIRSAECFSPEINAFKEIRSKEGISFQESQKFWDSYFGSEIKENPFFSAYEEGLNQIPGEHSDLGKWDSERGESKFIPNGSEIKENSFFSAYEERLNQTPGEHSDLGKWDGERGESKFIPNDSEIIEILQKYGVDGISYENAIPDFLPVSESTVEIDSMTENRAGNFRQCDEKCAKQWNKEEREGRTDWVARDVALWRKENDYSWHERNNMKTCDLIPSKINAYCGHLGGVSECRKRDALNNRGDFDE